MLSCHDYVLQTCRAWRVGLWPHGHSFTQRVDQGCSKRYEIRFEHNATFVSWYRLSQLLDIGQGPDSMPCMAEGDESPRSCRLTYLAAAYASHIYIAWTWVHEIIPVGSAKAPHMLPKHRLVWILRLFVHYLCVCRVSTPVLHCVIILHKHIHICILWSSICGSQCVFEISVCKIGSFIVFGTNLKCQYAYNSPRVHHTW